MGHEPGGGLAAELREVRERLQGHQTPPGLVATPDEQPVVVALLQARMAIDRALQLIASESQ